MRILRELRLSSRRLILPVSLIFVLCYVYYHTLTGDRGLLVWYVLHQQVEQLQAENAALQSNVDRLQRDVDRLSAKSPDLDYIDEVVRRNMPVMKPDERVVYIPWGLPPTPQFGVQQSETKAPAGQ